jgi:hypothetical protein
MPKKFENLLHLKMCPRNFNILQYFFTISKNFQIWKSAPNTENMPKNLENMENVHNFFENFGNNSKNIVTY